MSFHYMVNMSIRKVCFLLFLLFCCGDLVAQQSTYLEQYIRQAIEVNLNVLMKKMDSDIANKDIQIAKTFKYPTIKLASDYTVAYGGRRIAFPLGDVMNPVYSTLYQITGNESLNLELNDYEEQLAPNNFYNVGLSGIWSLLNKKITLNNKVANELVKLEMLELEIFEKELIKDIKINYLELYRLKNMLDIQAEVGAYLTDLKNKTSKLIEKGFVEAIDEDYIDYEIYKQREQQQLIYAKQQSLKAKFNALVGNSLDMEIMMDEDSLILSTLDKLAFDEGQLQVDLSRKEFEIFDVKKRIVDYDIEKGEKKWQPDINLVGQTGFEGFLEDISLKNYYVRCSVSASWDLFDGGLRNHDIEKNKIKQELLALGKEDTAEKLLLQMVDRLNSLSAKRVTMETSERKVALANKVYANHKKKYLQGKIDVVDVLKYHLEYETSKINLSNLKIEYVQDVILCNWAFSP